MNTSIKSLVMEKAELPDKGYCDGSYVDGYYARNHELTKLITQLAEVIEKCEAALNHCRDFDTSSKFGYDYGQKVRGHEPAPGSRWLTPREKAMFALAELDALKLEMQK